MRLVVFGADGQVGRELQRLGVTGIPRGEADITAPRAVEAALERHAPDLVFNAAAYTAVDRAESEPQAAYAINRDGAANLAAACARRGAPLLHYSTDYVFDGRGEAPYAEESAVAPLGVYGRSKWEGEQAVRATHEQHLILRTAWVFSAHGHNFVKSILRLAGERDELRVVADQRGCPTPARAIAAASLEIARQLLADARGRWGTYHFCGSPAATWHDLARAVVATAARHGPLKAQRVTPIPTAQYPTAAARPAWSVLDCRRIQEQFGILPPSWEEALDDVIGEILNG